MICFPRVVRSKSDLPRLSLAVTPRPNVYVTVTWKRYEVDYQGVGFYSIEMSSLKEVMPCRVTKGRPPDFDEFVKTIRS